MHYQFSNIGMLSKVRGTLHPTGFVSIDTQGCDPHDVSSRCGSGDKAPASCSRPRTDVGHRDEERRGQRPWLSHTGRLLYTPRIADATSGNASGLSAIGSRSRGQSLTVLLLDAVQYAHRSISFPWEQASGSLGACKDDLACTALRFLQ